MQIFAPLFRRKARHASAASRKFLLFPQACGGGASIITLAYPPLSSPLDHGNAPVSDPDPTGTVIRGRWSGSFALADSLLLVAESYHWKENIAIGRGGNAIRAVIPSSSRRAVDAAVTVGEIVRSDSTPSVRSGAPVEITADPRSGTARRGRALCAEARRPASA